MSLAILNKVNATEQRIGKMLPDRSPAALVDRPAGPFVRFIRRVYPQYAFYAYARLLIRKLEAVERGDITRLMVFMPPRHGKSELVSRLFPAWCLMRSSSRWVGVNSYGAELAYGFSRRARDYYRQAGGALNDEAAAVKEWETQAGGGLWAAGVGGPITGKGFDIGIIDDPLKNAEEAASPTIRAKQKEWYDSTFYTREAPGGAIIVVQTRWHPDDLSGWLLEKEKTSEQPEEWHVVSMDALHTELPDVPDSCTLETDWRSLGEPLCPERYPRPKLKRIKANVSSKVWASLYQQRPVDSEGALWKWDWIERASAPELERIVIGVDPAGGGGDEHGIICVGRGTDGLGYVLDDGTQPGSASPNTWARAVVSLYHSRQADRVAAERNFGGDMVESTLRTVDEHLSIKMVNASRGKQVRAEPVAALYENGRVRHAGRFDQLEQQMTTWDPLSDKSSPDRVDALVWALTELMLDRSNPSSTSASVDRGATQARRGRRHMVRNR